MRRPFGLLAALVVVVVFGCAGRPPATRELVADTCGLWMPTTYRGDLPCADCEGIRHHLDLWPDGAFHLRREWLGRDLVRFDLGRWSVDSSRCALVLQGADEAALEFEIIGPGQLRLLDRNGRPIDSTLPYVLRDRMDLDPVEVSAAMGGELALVEHELRFTECLTGRTYPIADKGDIAPVQEASYRVAGARVYVTIDGTIAGGTVVVDRFINAWPGENCERSRAVASLVNTYWRVDRLGEDAVRVEGGTREPHLILRHADGGASYNATAGCNQMSGGFAVNGGSITLSPGPTTLMGCPPSLDALETRLREALAQTRYWRVIGNTLEFTDESGASLALFEAVYLR